jgi:hypothetical protein
VNRESSFIRLGDHAVMAIQIQLCFSPRLRGPIPTRALSAPRRFNLKKASACIGGKNNKAKVETAFDFCIG